MAPLCLQEHNDLQKYIQGISLLQVGPINSEDPLLVTSHPVTSDHGGHVCVT